MLPWLAPGGEILLFMVPRSLENAFEAIVHLTMLSNIDVYTKSQPQSPCSFMQISLYIILLTRNSMASKIAFPWSLLHLEFIVWKFPAIIVVILYLCTQKDIPFCTTEECAYSWILDLCVLQLNGFCNSSRKWWFFKLLIYLDLC